MMPFHEIDNLSAMPVNRSVPLMGVRVKSNICAGGSRGPDRAVRYLTIVLGANLAAKLRLQGPATRVHLLFGTGDDAGQIAIIADANAGKFVAKSRKNGTWAITVSQASAEGLFAMTFPPFTVCEAQLVQLPGKPAFATFKASAEMLAA